VELQKKTLGATERDEEARSSFRERLRGVDPKCLIFVDESSTNIALTPRYARAPEGERAYGKAPRNWGKKNVTLISSISTEGMGASMSIEGSSDTESFGLYMRNLLAPQLKRGQIVLMDNLSVHRSRWVRELIEERGCQLWLLPVAPACGSCLWLLPVAPAQLLAGAQPHRRSLLQGEKPVEEGEGENPPGTLRSHRGGAPSGQ
jgi:DDE superfamily endonuclease